MMTLNFCRISCPILQWWVTCLYPHQGCGLLSYVNHLSSLETRRAVACSIVAPLSSITAIFLAHPLGAQEMHVGV